MKTILTLALTGIITYVLGAQQHEYALSYGYNTTPTRSCLLANGNVLVLGRSEIKPDQLMTDTVFALIFSPDAQILHRFNLPVPLNEIRYADDVVATPNGGFIVSIAAQNCDAGPVDEALQGYDQDGNLLWNLELDYGLWHLDIAPDGSPIVILYHTMIALDYLTGATLWECELTSNNNFEINDLDFIPGSWDFVATGNPDIQFWHQNGTPPVPQYSLQSAENLIGNIVLNKVLATEAGIYAQSSYPGAIIRYDGPNYNTVFNSPIFPPLDFIKADSGFFWVLTREIDRNTLLRLSYQGQVSDTLGFGDKWRWATQVVVSDSLVFVQGECGSGDVNIPASVVNPLGYYDAKHLWVQRFTMEEPPGDIGTAHNAALTEVIQGEPMSVSYSTSPFWGTLTNEYGGDFSARITNNGDSILQSVDVMIVFPTDYSWGICYEKPAGYFHLDHLGLLPGQSAVVPLGDVLASGQKFFPSQFCFWTAAPNMHPDASHDDDAFCLAIYTDASEPATTRPLEIYPNPSCTGEFFISWKNTGQLPPCFEMFDWSGRLVLTGRVDTGVERIRIDAGHLAAGTYWIRMGRDAEKVVLMP